MKEEWLFPGAVVPVDVETTAALVAEIKRLIDVVGGLILKQGPDYERGFVDCHATGVCVQSGLRAEQPAQQEPNRVIAYAAASKLRELGYEWMNDAWTHLDELAEQPAQQEPVAWIEGVEIYWRNAPDLNDWIRQNGQPLYTSPPAQRTWQGLTDVERHECTQFPFSEMNHRAIEAKLRSKNT